MTLPRCATCRWWERYDTLPSDDMFGWGYCPRTDKPDALFRANDNFMNTHETFGCVQHEPIPAHGETTS